MTMPKVALAMLAAGLTACATRPQPLPVSPVPAYARAPDATCEQAKPLVRLKPRYPRAALHDGQEGWVLLKLDVLPDGTPSNVTVVDASPKGVFDGAAVAAVEQWRVSTSPAGHKGCLQLIEFKFSDDWHDDGRQDPELLEQQAKARKREAERLEEELREMQKNDSNRN